MGGELIERSRSEECAIYSFLVDVCVHAEIPKAILDYTYSYFKEIREKLSQRKTNKNKVVASYALDETLSLKETRETLSPHGKINNKAVASYALYETLSRHNVPRTASEIQYFTGCDTSLLFKIESSLHLTETLNKPQDFVSRFCSILNLRFRDERRIKSIVENMFGMASIRPHCIVAVAIFLYCKEKNIDCPLKRICETCDVTSTNIYSVIRKMKTLYVNKITLLCSPNVISI